ncbi:MAG: N-acetyltransferase [Rhodospirillaceae bacterium]|nr:MAG: N-acetyltransferase [Rhodospirillaceae bacterium]
METRSKTAVRLRDMVVGDLVQAHVLSRAAQWPHRLEDWQFLLQLGQGVVAEQDGAIVGTAMGWPFGPHAATLGMVIVSPECQGGGVGRKLMNAIIEHLGDRTIMLNATDVGLPLYKSLGFETVGTVYQHQGAAFTVSLPLLGRGERIRPMGSGDRAAVFDLDRRAMGMPREKLVTALQSGARGVVLDRDGEALGFALFRRFGRGHVVGPTVAPDIDGAKALISHWLGSNTGMLIRLDVSEAGGLSGWLETLDLTCVGRVTTMVRGTPLKHDDAIRTFALVSQALG